MLALLRFVENPRDRIAGFRVMQESPRPQRVYYQRRGATLETMTEDAFVLECADWRRHPGQR
jgi:hypothetical protein